eukprot:6060983-Pleurochrysis_carterae.AAC.2
MPRMLRIARSRSRLRVPRAYSKSGGKSMPSSSFSVNKLHVTESTTLPCERLHLSMMRGGISVQTTLIPSRRTTTPFDEPYAGLPIAAARVWKERYSDIREASSIMNVETFAALRHSMTPCAFTV